MHTYFATSGVRRELRSVVAPVAQEPIFETLGPLTPLPPLPVSPTEKAEQEDTALRMSLKDLTKLALQNNLDIAISGLNEEWNQQAIVQARGAFDPSLGAGLGVLSQKSANTNLQTRSIIGNFNKFDIAKTSGGNVENQK